LPAVGIFVKVENLKMNVAVPNGVTVGVRLGVNVIVGVRDGVTYLAVSVAPTARVPAM
jgi:hypothetical protein